MAYFFPSTTIRTRLIAILALMLLLASIFALLMGPFGFEFQMLANPSTFRETIILRSSRIILALLCGAVLGGTGCSLQAVLRNPLADPYIIGVAGGAALGGALSIAMFSHLTLATPLASIAGALLASLTLYRLFLPKYQLQEKSILLAGIAFNMFAAAFITFIKVMLPAHKSQALLFWLVGAIRYIEYDQLLIISLVVLFGLGILLRMSGSIELLAQGDDEAQRLGQEIAKTKILVYLACSVILGITIAFSGMIGFVGLIVPNLLRVLFGPNQNILLPSSIILGAISLAFFDALSRYSFFLFQTEVPVGAITALFGAPIFVALILKQSSTRCHP